MGSASDSADITSTQQSNIARGLRVESSELDEHVQNLHASFADHTDVGDESVVGNHGTTTAIELGTPIPSESESDSDPASVEPQAGDDWLSGPLCLQGHKAARRYAPPSEGSCMQEWSDEEEEDQRKAKVEMSKRRKRRLECW